VKFPLGIFDETVREKETVRDDLHLKPDITP
jgi:hypothetical protein